MTCNKCQGTKHVMTKAGTWARCACLATGSFDSDLVAAGVPETLRDRDAESLRAASGVLAKIKLGQAKPVSWWLRGSPVDPAFVAGWCYPLRLAVEDGLTAARVTLTEAVDARFTRESRPPLDAKLRAAVLVVSLEGVDHKFAVAELESIWQARAFARVFTLYTSAADVTANPARFGRGFARAMAGKDVRRFVVDSFNESGDQA